MFHDFRLGVRALVRSPLFTLTAIAILALGIGVNSTLFSFLRAALLRPLPGIAAPERLAWISTIRRERPRPINLSYPDFLDYRGAGYDVFEDMLAFHTGPFSLGSGGDPLRVQGQIVSGSFFPTLGVVPAAGRLLERADDVTSAPRAVAVVSYRLWLQRFDGAPDIAQRSAIINGQTFGVVGVAPEGFVGPQLGAPADLWIPAAAWPLARTTDRALLDARGSSEFAVIGRLRAGVSVRQAQASLARTAARLEAEHPATNADSRITVGAIGSPIPPSGMTEVVPLAALLAGVTGLVLLVACANVANLLLARGAARSPEILVRAALGASRSRLIRELLAESTALAAAGAIAGLLLALWAGDLIAASAGEAMRGLRIEVDGTVVGFTIAVSCATTLLFGLVPALVATRTALAPSLKTAAAVGGRSRAQAVFIVTQLALSMVLVIAAGLSLRTLQKSAATDLGFRSGGLLTASYDLALQNYPDARRAAFRRALLGEVRALPGVTSAAIANMAPLGGTMVGRAAGPSERAGSAEPALVFCNGVGPGYFLTMGIGVTGREFNEGDSASAPKVAIVNRTFARRFWEDGNAAGRRVDLDGLSYQVVGVASDSKYDEPAEGPTPFVYLSLAQSPQLDSETLLVRSANGPGAIEPAVREIIRRLDPALPVFDARPFERLLAARSDKQRAVASMFAVFSAVALLLAAVGTYGVMAYTVSRRSREIGVRIALGATRAQVARLVVRDGVRLAATGAGTGMILALPMTRVLGTVVFGIQLGDVAPFAAGCAVLVVVTLAAALLPARRAARLDPIAALRSE